MSESLYLRYLPPWDWQQFHQYFALRLLPGVEALEAHRYSRSVRMGDRCGWFCVSPLPDQAQLELQISDNLIEQTPSLSARIRKMFDLDADPAVLLEHFAGDPLLGPVVASNPGLRLPTAFDPFEQSVRAIVGQQVSVRAAVTITRRLVERLGEPLPQGPHGLCRLFPTAAAVAEASLENIGMPGKRVLALQRFAAAVAEGALHLHVEAGADELVRRLCELPGIGPWTAEYIALRGFGEPDAFPAADLGLLKAPLWGAETPSAKALQIRAEAWRPWRAYAAAHIWHNYG